MAFRSGLIQPETWKLAWDALRTNKIRAMLTMLGVIIGSACIVLVVTVALAGKNTSLARSKGSAPTWYTPSPPAAPPTAWLTTKFPPPT